MFILVQILKKVNELSKVILAVCSR